MPRRARIVVPNCPHHYGHEADGSGLLDLRAWGACLAAKGWQQTLHERLKEPASAMRLNTHRGRPLGGDGFPSKIESLLGRRLRPLPIGRPRREGNR
jgi:hypothetical protein